MKKFAVFDIDGTLIRWQLFHVAIDKLAKSGVLGSEAHQQIHEARMNWKRRVTNKGFPAYEQTLVKLYERAITKVSSAQFDAIITEITEEYKDQVYTYTRDLIKHLRSEGYLLFAISGSQKELVSEIANYYGFDDCIATEYDRTKNGFSGKVYVASHDKEAALSKLISQYKLDTKGSYAVGDSKSDAPMLRMVENPIAFNPDGDLFELAKQAGWKVVLERKNMVYEMEPQNGQYVLVKTGE